MNKNINFALYTLALILIGARPCCSSKCSTVTPRSKPGFAGMFGFGDSVIDNGNNNFLKSGIKSDYLPYGIDFPLSPFSTRRFTNGENPADRISDLLELSSIPTFTDPLTKGSRVSNGVNFASGASGILDSTGSKKGVISLNQQIKNFVEVTIPMLKTQQKCGDKNLLEKYLFLISTGSNDFLDTFFKGGYHIGTLQYFSDNLTSSLSTQLTRLYDAGARKFAFINIGPIGCTPMVRASMPQKECNETMNYASFYFNTQLLVMLNSIKPRMPGFQFMVVNYFQIGLEFIRYPSRGGFDDVINSCCEVSQASNGALCKQGVINLCTTRRSHLFFDGVHPTESLYSILAIKAYNSTDPTEVSPFNLHRFSQI